MVKKKAKSGRVSLKDKYKVAKKVRDHHKKQRKEARKHPHRKAMRKDPGIPNLWPFKEDMLRQIEARAEKAEQQKLQQKERRQKEVVRGVWVWV
jgi:nuclear GTP-binding protein